PRSLSNEFYSQMKTIMEKQLRIDTPLKFDTFTSAVIDRNSFNRIRMYIDYARKSSSTKIIFGGECNDSVGFYIQPTLIET
ncbi:unnamed protein product, partial [Rotaria socialis]